MTFALVQVSPFSVIKTFMADAPPDPVVWPDGAATHGVATTGVGHGPWALLPTNYTPSAPTQYHTLFTTLPIITATSVIFQQTWTPMPLSTVQSALLNNVSSGIGQAASVVVDVNPASLFIYQERLFEARALAQWFLSTTAQAATTSYPLLFATIGVERALDGSVATTMANIMSVVLNGHSQWLANAAPLIRSIASAHIAINACTTVIDAVNAFNNANLGSGISTAVAST